MRKAYLKLVGLLCIVGLLLFMNACTQSQIPYLQTGLQKAQHALSILLGMPPGQLKDRLKGGSGIPHAPLEVAAGIPAELLCRRPDIRNAELQAASQCALIGVAKADLYPAFSLSGSFGFAATNVGVPVWEISSIGAAGPLFSDPPFGGTSSITDVSPTTCAFRTSGFKA